MSLDDYIRGLLNIPAPSGQDGYGDRGSRSRGGGGGGGGGGRGEEGGDARVRGAAGIDGLYDFDSLIRRQMQSMFAPFFGGSGGGRGGVERDFFDFGFPSNPHSSDDQGECETNSLHFLSRRNFISTRL